MISHIRFRNLCFAVTVSAFAAHSNPSTCISADHQSADHLEVNPRQELPATNIKALLHARLIDGSGGPVVENATVVVHGSRITYAGPSGVAIPAGAEKVNLQGLTILPGFVDSHFHSANDLNPPRTFLKNGLTTFRDPGHPLRFYDAVKQAKIPMPRVFLCGSHLDSYPPIWPEQAVLVDSPSRARAIVKSHVKRGATAIKIYFRLPLHLIAPVCEAADELNVPVTAHLELVKAVDAIHAGVDGIEHITSFGTSLASAEAAAEFEKTIAADPKLREHWRYKLWASLDLDTNPRVPAVLKAIVDNSVVVSPTLAVFERRANYEDVSDAEVAGFQNMLKFTGMCHSAGAKVVVGSHTWVRGAKFGLAFQREMELLVECGLTTEETLVAATRLGAEFLRTSNRLGTVKSDQLADLVVIEGNPLADISAARNVRRVMLGGAWIPR